MEFMFACLPYLNSLEQCLCKYSFALCSSSSAKIILLYFEAGVVWQSAQWQSKLAQNPYPFKLSHKSDMEMCNVYARSITTQSGATPRHTPTQISSRTRQKFKQLHDIVWIPLYGVMMLWMSFTVFLWVHSFFYYYFFFVCSLFGNLTTCK